MSAVKLVLTGASWFKSYRVEGTVAENLPRVSRVIYDPDQLCSRWFIEWHADEHRSSTWFGTKAAVIYYLKNGKRQPEF